MQPALQETPIPLVHHCPESKERIVDHLMELRDKKAAEARKATEEAEEFIKDAAVIESIIAMVEGRA